ncbi:MAG: YceI family protein [Solirubrobacteraceae bacterium]
MGRRARIVVLAVVGVAVVLIAGGYAVLALTGDDAPPPPRLQGTPAQEGAVSAGAGRWHPVAPAGSFVGYRVDERYLGVGVRTAVGRTSAVTGSVTVDGHRVERAELRADMTTVHSDQARRDDSLRSRAIETDRYPSARFTLAGPVAIGARPRRARGTLTLHGRSAAIAVTVRGQPLSGDRLELVGSAPIRFASFAIEPPSVAGLVTVSDHGVLEFRLVLARG